jgi:hypothetical protein
MIAIHQSIKENISKWKYSESFFSVAEFHSIEGHVCILEIVISQKDDRR